MLSWHCLGEWAVEFAAKQFIWPMSKRPPRDSVDDVGGGAKPFLEFAKQNHCQREVISRSTHLLLLSFLLLLLLFLLLLLLILLSSLFFSFSFFSLFFSLFSPLKLIK